MRGWLLIETLPVLPLANASASGCRGWRLVCDYSWARCSMVAVTR